MNLAALLMSPEMFIRIGGFVTGDDSFRMLLSGLSRPLWESRREDRLYTVRCYLDWVDFEVTRLRDRADFEAIRLREAALDGSVSSDPDTTLGWLEREDDCWGC